MGTETIHLWSSYVSGFDLSPRSARSRNGLVLLVRVQRKGRAHHRWSPRIQQTYIGFVASLCPIPLKIVKCSCVRNSHPQSRIHLNSCHSISAVRAPAHLATLLLGQPQGPARAQLNTEHQEKYASC